jgi:adenine-specific DNA-methyltransferase
MTKFDKLKSLLKELFQLDHPDLDFGLYRIMHAKSAEVTQFLERDLLPQVKAALAQYQTANKSELEAELAKAVEQARSLGVDPEATQKVKDLRARLATEAVDIDQLEADVYDHLYQFFSRYYSDGDFLSKRRYSKDGKYAIPYDGEEVKLYWPTTTSTTSRPANTCVITPSASSPTTKPTQCASTSASSMPPRGSTATSNPPMARIASSF